MVERLTVEQARRIAGLAQAARLARDGGLATLPERDLGEARPARGEHNPTAEIGLDPLPADHPARLALQSAIRALPVTARSELLALLWVARGEYAAKDWVEAVSAASTAPEAAVEVLADEPDLHDLVMKGLYERVLME